MKLSVEIRKVLRITFAGALVIAGVGMGRAPVPTDRGGNEVPIGLEWRKQRYELADGETYTLLGTIVDTGYGVPAFMIDYDEQVWLANRAQVQTKIGYPISMNLVDLPKFSGVRVRASVRANAYIDTSSVLPQIRIRLTLLDTPIAAPVDPRSGAKSVAPRSN